MNKTMGNLILMTLICVAVFMIFMALRPARADVSLPTRMLRTWCFDMRATETSQRYVRAPECENGEIILGTKNYEEIGIESDAKVSCTAINTTVALDRKYNNIFTVCYRCHGYQGSSKKPITRPWLETKRIWLGKGTPVGLRWETHI